MKSIAKLTTIAASLVAALALVSCASTSASGPAVMCSKCKTVWVKTTTTVGPPSKGYIVYRNKEGMNCAECENAAAAFFKGGTLKHHCATCGETLSHCEAH